MIFKKFFHSAISYVIHFPLFFGHFFLSITLKSQISQALSAGTYFLHRAVAPAAQKVHPEMFPELVVPDAVNDGAQEPGQDVDDQVVCKSDLQDATREDDVQDDLDARGDVGEHAHGQLGAVEEDGVPGFLGRRPLCGEGPGCEQDPQVGEDQNQKHAGEIDDVKGFPLFSQDHVFEDVLT